MSSAYGVDQAGLPSPVGTQVMEQREGILASLSVINTAEGVTQSIWCGLAVSPPPPGTQSLNSSAGAESAYK